MTDSQLDADYARLTRILFFTREEFISCWRYEFKGTRFERGEPRNVVAFATPNGGRAFYFRDLIKGLSVQAICPVNSPCNWMSTAANWELEPCRTVKGCKIVAGLQNVLLATPAGYRHTLIDELDVALADDKNEIVYTGLSFGGALAQLYAIHRPPSSLVTFGALRIGDEALLRHLPEGRFYVNRCDPVPSLPPWAATPLNTEAGDCKNCPEGYSVLCHGHYLGIDYVTLDILMHLQDVFDFFRIAKIGRMLLKTKGLEQALEAADAALREADRGKSFGLSYGPEKVEERASPAPPASEPAPSPVKSK
jgi:pimeloyl-ACP methyl ester carboxylesterase